MDAKPVVISDTLRRIIDISRTTFAEKHLAIVIDTDMPVGDEIPKALGDATFCYSMFQNLIKNGGISLAGVMQRESHDDASR